MSLLTRGPHSGNSAYNHNVQRSREETRRRRPSLSVMPARRSTRTSQEWRTIDHRPRCFYCRETDQVYRHWPYHRLCLSGFPLSASRSERNKRPQEVDDYLRQKRRMPQSPFRRSCCSLPRHSHVSPDRLHSDAYAPLFPRRGNQRREPL